MIESFADKLLLVITDGQLKDSKGSRPHYKDGWDVVDAAQAVGIPHIIHYSSTTDTRNDTDQFKCIYKFIGDDEHPELEEKLMEIAKVV